jgi:cytochrome c biogenesis protein CcmG/thiol:disulfide interchange protein DsbE
MSSGAGAGAGAGAGGAGGAGAGGRGGAGRRAWIVPVIVVLGLAAIVALGWGQRDRYTPIGVGSEMPSYAAPTVAGPVLSLDSLRGQVVVLNVWATWCAPCRYEMPSLQRLYEALGSSGLEVVAVSVDEAPLVAEPLDAVRGLVASFAAEYGLTFPVLLDPQGRVEETFAVSGLPTTFVIGRDGRIREKVIGGREWDRGEVAVRVRALVEEDA